MAEAAFGNEESSTCFGYYRATGATIYSIRVNKSCDTCKVAKRKCDHKLPCRFSPSPATGLVGMKENAFLSDFFGGLGFLPLTSQSHIREIIVKMMTSASGLALTSRFSERVTGPSACILWSAIALGALAKGAPPEEVDVYRRVASAEIHVFSPLPAEAVRAWTILGYVHGFLGDKEEFSRCLKRADALMGACNENGCKEPFPIGLAEIIKSDKSMSECEMSREDMQALSAEKILPPEMSSYPSEAEVYRYMLASNRALIQVYARLSLSATAAVQRDADGSDNFATTELPQDECGVNEREESRIEMVSIPPDTVWSTFKDSSFDLDMLEQAVAQRSSVGDGVGGAILNMLSPDFACWTQRMVLSIAAAGEFDRLGVFEKAKHIVHVSERYPGLFRFTCWSHAPHYLAALLARMEDPEARSLYDMVRMASNLVRNSSFPAIPPLEEWRGMSSICDDPACRMFEHYVERLLTSAPYELTQGAMQVDSDVDDASRVELLHYPSEPTPGSRPLPPDGEVRFASNGEDDGIQDIDLVAVDGDIEIEMLSTLANAEPASLEEALFSQRGAIDMEGSPAKPEERRTLFPISLGDGTRTDGEFLQSHSTYITTKMDESHGTDTAAENESIDAKDWLETINTLLDARLV